MHCHPEKSEQPSLSKMFSHSYESTIPLPTNRLFSYIYYGDYYEKLGLLLHKGECNSMFGCLIDTMLEFRVYWGRRRGEKTVVRNGHSSIHMCNLSGKREASKQKGIPTRSLELNK
jgi:hypothetical protein